MTTTNIGILPWRNETGMFNYPLSDGALGVTDFIVDAYFIQFDSFVPTLKSITASADSIDFLIGMDVGDRTFSLAWPDSTGKLNLQDPATGRLMGRLFFGAGISEFYDSNLGAVVPVGSQFASSVVHAIPESCGVFSIEHASGAVVVAGDGNLFFTTTTQGIVFDAVGVPICDTSIHPIKSVNSISAPNINLLTNDIINWVPTGNGIRLDLAAGSIFNTSIQPST